ncbi:histidine kinase dimerization/phospho-acceptor domain-containing protein [Burkholderia anthina]|uniref:histidine kinase dimerization/phospho-acceptor domain-containing protein n=1 Tax=Burkholderia anthina TaxID=179879 RepID=UPI003C7D911E
MSHEIRTPLNAILGNLELLDHPALARDVRAGRSSHAHRPRRPVPRRGRPAHARRSWPARAGGQQPAVERDQVHRAGQGHALAGCRAAAVRADLFAGHAGLQLRGLFL